MLRLLRAHAFRTALRPAGALPLRAQAVQPHGLLPGRRVCDPFFAGHRPRSPARQRIDEPFILAVGFRRQVGEERRFVNFAAPRTFNK